MALTDPRPTRAMLAFLDEVLTGQPAAAPPRPLAYLTPWDRFYKRDKRGRFGAGDGSTLGASAGEVAGAERLNGGKTLDRLDPDQRRVSDAIHTWSEGGNDGARLRLEAQQALGPNGHPDADTDGAAFVRTVAAAPADAPTLYRGMREVRTGSMPTQGEVFELGPTSFTRSKAIRDRFTQPESDDYGAPTQVRIKLKAGSRSLRIDKELTGMEHADEQEHVTLGKFRVTDYKESVETVKAKDGTRKEVTVYDLTIEQVPHTTPTTHGNTTPTVGEGTGDGS